MSINKLMLLSVFFLGGLLSPAASALDLVAGYTLGGNDPLQLGSDFIIDQAATGGGDATVAGGFFGWVAEYTDMWEVGTPVSLTGVAVPIHAVGVDTTSQNGDWTFTFFELDGGPNPNNFDGYNFSEATGETVLGSVTAAFNGFGTTGVDEYYLAFDSPINFTSASTGLAFHMQSTASIRVKTRPAGLVASRGVRVGLADGAPVGGANPNFRATLAGTPVAFDPPPPPGPTHRVDASLDMPGDNRWDTIAPSSELYIFDAMPGDYNGNRVTDAADYTVWRDNDGGDADVAFAAGSRDAANSGPVNAADYSFWQTTFGTTPIPVDVADATVPGITKAYEYGAVGRSNFWDSLVGGVAASRQDASFEIWFKPDSLLGGDQILYEFGGAASGGYIGLQGDQLSFYVHGQFADRQLSSTLATADWTQVVGVLHDTFDPVNASQDDYLELYVNGVKIGDTMANLADFNDWAGGNQSAIGQVGGNLALEGPIDATTSRELEFDGQIAIFEYVASALTDVDVMTRYQAITTSPVNAVPEPNSLVMLGLLAVGVAARGTRFTKCDRP